MVWWEAFCASALQASTCVHWREETLRACTNNCKILIPALSQEMSTDEEILGFASFLLVEDWNQACYGVGDSYQESET